MSQCFLQQDNQGIYAGTHLIIEVCDASNLNNEQVIRQLLDDCVQVSGATMLHLHTHVFSPSGGISGVAILAESHISIHTWPEIAYAGMDIFMCGDAQPKTCLEVIKACFTTDNLQVTTHRRGLGLI